MKKYKLTNEQKAVAEKQLLQKQSELEYRQMFHSVATLLELFKNVDMKMLDCQNHQWGFSWCQQDACWYIEEILLGVGVCGSIELSLLDKDNYIPANDISLKKLQAIHSFINNELVLSGLRTLTLLEGFCFSDLSKHQQNQFFCKEIQVALHETASKSNYGLVLIEKPLDDGLTKSDVSILLNMLPNNTEVFPVDLETECFAAMGFITERTANFFNYDWREDSEIGKYICGILNDSEKENPDGEYEFDGIRIYMGHDLDR